MYQLQAVKRLHLELLFLTVLALPNASRTGLDCNSQNSPKHPLTDHITYETKAIKCNTTEMTIHKTRVINCHTSRTCCSTVRPSVAARPPRKARYCISIFVVSVLPAPLSPLTRIELLFPSFIMALFQDKILKYSLWNTIHVTAS